MDKKSLIAATIFAATLPALAGTVMENTAGARATRAHSQQDARNRAGETAQQHPPAVRPSGPLTIDASGKQAKAVTPDTNRKIAQGQITPQRSTATPQSERP